MLPTLWFVPMAIGWFAGLGAATLLIADRHDALLKPLAIWTAVMAGGWVFSLGTVALTGLAATPSREGMGWQVALTFVGAGAYLIGVIALTVMGVMDSSPREEDHH